VTSKDETTAATPQRIDLTQFEGIGDWEVVPQPDGDYAIVTGRDNSSLEEAYIIAKLPTLITELKRMYEREDTLFDAIKELRDSEDSTGCSEDLTVVRLSAMQTLYELFPDTAYWGCACQGPHTGPC